MNTWSESRLEYRELAASPVTGPLERLWQSPNQETVFLSAAELDRREHDARTSAMMETETRLKHEYDLALTAARRELIQSLAAFQSHRADYFHDMEHEVVRLALAISRTVIERELEINPTLLEAAARDVLQRIEAGSKIRLRVPTTDVSAWQASLAMEVDRGIRVEILGDDKAICGQCIVETGLGTTEFNIAERLREIEATLLQCSPGDDASRTRPVLVQ